MLTESYKPIRNYSLIGDCHSAALVGLDGSIDWCCFPRFDAPSVFAALLDAEKGGHFGIYPQGQYSASQRYVGDTNVLETEFTTEGASCTLTDFMPLYRGQDGAMVAPRQIIRILRCQQGAITLQVDYRPRADFGRMLVSLTRHAASVVCPLGNGGMLSLSSAAPLELSSDQATGSLTLKEGQEAAFVLGYEQDGEAGTVPRAATAQQQLARTRHFWEEKAGEMEYDGPHRQAVMRSYLALHLLTYLPTGAIVAAPTTSLPEWVGGERNWDYRYIWLRDAAFTVDALMSLGHLDEATSFFHWLCEVCTECAERQRLQIMFRVDGDPDLQEEELPHLAGYRASRPVRIGNKAYAQQQHDIYGEILASAYPLFKRGQPPSHADWSLLRMLASMAATHWREPDSGMWEVRGGPYHFVHSKVMCWVALDRAAALAQMTGRAGAESEAWEAEAAVIKEEVLVRGWSERKQAFVQHYDTEAMDASNLLLPLVGFLPADDPRVVSTVRRIREELGEGPFLKRYRTEETDDGLSGDEGAFTLCSFWLVQVLAQMGKREEALRLFDELLKFGNHTGLFSEMIDPSSGGFLGNFPQAFTHIGLILAARECGVGQERQ